MQISSEQVSRLRDAARKNESTNEAPVESVQDLAARHGLSMDEVRRHTERALMAEEDPARERRVTELARRVAEGSYNVSSEDLLDMAERRAIADNAGRI
jgi:anti-sigma28 factor (negative regulator of flagellin synthesis)